MARNTKVYFTAACLLWLLVLFMGSWLVAPEARPLNNVAADSASSNAVGNSIEALDEGLYVEAIKAGEGPSPGGKGHGYHSVAFKNSGPSPGEGH
ncbi:uncharacterized protein J3R85_016782 [Psidium guajava]|nr:uncharacterized protein J3R85_016782 [Psidium guajava]